MRRRQMIAWGIVVLATSGAVLTAAERAVPWLAEVQQPPAATDAKPLAPLWTAEQGPLTRAAWLAHRPKLIAQWDEFLGPSPQRPSDNSWTVLKTEKVGEVRRELIEYQCEPDLRVQAYLLRPAGDAPARSRAGVVALHPTTTATIDEIAGVSGREDRQTGMQLAQRGFVVLCPRCFLWQDVTNYQQAVERVQQRHPRSKGMRKMLFDAQRAVDLLVAQPDVDPQRLGAVGHSLGAKEVLYLMAFDERIRAGVASEGGVGLTSTNWDAPWYLGPTIRDADFARNHHELIALIAPRAMLILGGEQGPGAADGDRSWPYIAAALPMYRLFGEPARVGLFNHHAGHSIPPKAHERQVEWLEAYTAP